MNEKEEDETFNFHRNVTDVLKDLAYLGDGIKKHSLKLLKESQEIEDLDINNIEYLGLKTIKLIAQIKANIFTFIHSLLKLIGNINENRGDKLFDEVYNKLIEVKQSYIVFESDDQPSFTLPCDKETMVDFPCEGLSSSKVLIKENPVEDTSFCDASIKKNTILSLKKDVDNRSTPNTDDDWCDSLCRGDNQKTVFLNEDKSNEDISECTQDDQFIDKNSNSSELFDNDQKSPILCRADNESPSVLLNNDTNLQNSYKIGKNADRSQTEGSISHGQLENEECQTPKETIEMGITIDNNTIESSNYKTNIDNDNTNKEIINPEKSNAAVFDQSSRSTQSDKLEGAAERKETNTSYHGETYDKVNEYIQAGNSEEANHRETQNNEFSGDAFSQPTQILQTGSLEEVANTEKANNEANNACNQPFQNLQDGSSDKAPQSNLSSKNDDDDDAWSTETVDFNYRKQLLAKTDNMNSKNEKNESDSDETYIESEIGVPSKNCKSSPGVIIVNEDSSSRSTNRSPVIDVSETLNFIEPTPDEPSENVDAGNVSEEHGDFKCKRIYVREISELRDRMVVESPENDNSLPRSNTNDKVFEENNTLMDVTMEEIISNENETNFSNNIKDISIKCEPDIKKETEDLENNLEEKFPSVDIGDELLELLRAAELPNSQEVENVKPKVEEDIEEVDKIITLLQEDDSDISDSDIEIFSDISLSDENYTEPESQLEGHKTRLLEEKHKMLHYLNLREKKALHCRVLMEKMTFSEEHITRFEQTHNRSINWLCNIDNLNKRKASNSDSDSPKSKRKYKRKKLSPNCSSSSNSDSEIEYLDSSQNLRKLGRGLEQKLDDLLANHICEDLEADNSESSPNESDSSSEMVTKKKKKNVNGDVKCAEKKELTENEKLKKSWKNDPLLKGKLSSDSETSSSDNDVRKKSKRKKKLSKYEMDSDFRVSSECSNSENETKNSTKTKLQASFAERISLIDNSDSNSDSDVVLVPADFAKSETTNEASSLQKGRRNIRALMSDEDLTEATQIANKEEMQRIERLKIRQKKREMLSQSFSETMNSNQDSVSPECLILDVDDTSGEPLVKVHPTLTLRLKPHQKLGVQFMWDSCYESLSRFGKDEGSGCILAHCMGLGKTYQVLTLIHTLFTHEATKTKHVLVVCPLSTVNNWKKEVKIAFKNLPESKFNLFTIANRKEISTKFNIVKKWYLRNKAVLVMGYECFETLTNEAKLEKQDKFVKIKMLEALVNPGPDLVICDEGHLLRNKKARKTEALDKIRTQRRIVLTGTPLQNNLLEYYFMVHFVKPNLLGNIKEFKNKFVNPITNGQYEDSTKHDIKVMKQRTHVLYKLLKKTIHRVEDTELKTYLPPIVDHTVFVQLHQIQVDLYHKFSEIIKRRSCTTNKKGFISDFCIFQYIGTHPNLLAIVEDMKQKKITERDIITNEEDNPICNIEGWWKAIMPSDAASKIEYGTKLVVLKHIIQECEEIGDKVLVFSQSLGELDLIEHFLKTNGTERCPSWVKELDYHRMDGTISPEYRTIICDLFNNKDNDRLRLLLMSTKVGGLGLNLTAANRVVIMTVNWNPSYDIQSVFRVYRFGQEKKVFVYRLVSFGTMEEKVYQRTVTKSAIAHRVVDKHQITRHYKSVDLKALYSCSPTADEERPTPKVPEDQLLAKLLLRLPFIFKFHEHQALLENRPEDDLDEQEKIAAWEEFEKEKNAVKNPPTQPMTTLPINIPSAIPTFANAFALSRSNVNEAGVIMSATRSESTSAENYFLTTSNVVQPQLIDVRQNQNTSKDPVVTVVDTSSINKPLPVNTNSNDSKKTTLILPGGNNNNPIPPLSSLNNQEHNTFSNQNKKENENLKNVKEFNSTKKKLTPNPFALNRQMNSLGNVPHNVPTLMKRSLNKDGVIPAKSSTLSNPSDESNNYDTTYSDKKRLARILKQMRDNFQTGVEHNYALTKNRSVVNLIDEDDAVDPNNSSDKEVYSRYVQNLGRSGVTLSRIENPDSDVIILD